MTEVDKKDTWTKVDTRETGTKVDIIKEILRLAWIQNEIRKDVDIYTKLIIFWVVAA